MERAWPAVAKMAASMCGRPPTARYSSGCRGIVVYGVVWSPDGTRLASGGGSRGSGEVVLWDTRSGAHCGERLYTIAYAPGSVLALDWSPRGEMLVSGASDGRLCWLVGLSGEW